MSLPPGCEAKPVAGINDRTDPELAKAAAELNAWVDYLLHPDSNDGPRIYREQTSEYGTLDSEMPRRMENLDEDSFLETVSVIEPYAGDPGVFFRAAEGISGIDEPLMHDTYFKLTEGVFTWNKEGPNDAHGEPEKRVPTRYPELHPARLNWMQMREGWHGDEAISAHEFENDFIRFQTHTENCFYVVAEHMAKYRGIFKRSAEDITELMNALMEKFARPHSYGDGLEFNLVTFLITGVVTAVSTVITGGAAAPTAALVLSKVAVAMVGNAASTAKEKGSEKHVLLENHNYLRDVAKQYVEAVNKIEEEVEQAVKDLYEHLRIQLDEIRKEREYQVIPTDGEKKSMFVPHYRDYL
jgi:hypothetical protein